ncbi:MAG: GNAT family N-acetyltransferase [Acutalibacteraceae bacterium]|nr:GNAT family N-acetyltransferase [Acutalibacteraceae bacterium]
MAVTYRKSIKTDFDTLAEMRIQQLVEEGAKPSFDLKPYLLDYYSRHFDDGTFISWLAADGGRLVGTSGMSFVEKPPYYGCPSGKIGLLSSMYVIKEYRRNGIARTLLDKVVRESEDYGCAMVQVTASDMGVLLYTGYGFQKNSNFMYYPF